jgi:hypothetical protein
MHTAVMDPPPPVRDPVRVSAVVELRQYTLHPGARDTLIDLFEREFVESQEAEGIDLIGQFRDLDAPDRFVWLRGFPSMEARARSLAAFYGGPAWRRHREAANATMIDSDDVLQLRPCRPVGGFALPPRAAQSAAAGDVVLAHLHPLREAAAAAFPAWFERAFVPLLWDANVGVGASLITDPRPNPFPALPVRSDTTVFAWFSRHASEAQSRAAQARIDEALEWSPGLADALAAQQSGPVRSLRLAPTPRSRLRG